MTKLKDLIYHQEDLVIYLVQKYQKRSQLIIDQKRQQDHINYVLRDTQYIKKEHFDKTVLTVWSAPNYCYRFGNKATVLILEKNSYKFFEFSLSMENKEIQETLKISIEKNKYFN